MIRRRLSVLVVAAVLVATGSIRNSLLAQSGFGLTGDSELADFPIIKQPDGISCGPTCCAMLLKYYGKSAGIGPLKTAAGTRFYQGPNLTGQQISVGLTLPSGIKDALATYGVFPTMQKGTLEDVKKLIDENRPPILLVRSDKDNWHYIIAVGHRFNHAKGKHEIKIADPAGSSYWKEEGVLQAAWQFSHGLGGEVTQGPKCNTCGGSGKYELGPLKTKCNLCNGDGRLTDIRRKIVESAGASGSTLIWVKHSNSGGKQSTPQATKTEVAKRIEYTIWNDSGRKVDFRLPSGKSYSLASGETGKYHYTTGGNDFKIHVFSTGKTYSLKEGNHKFWWKRDEQRVAFDLDYKK